MKIKLEISDKNEGTRSPWWVIIDPRQNFHVDKAGLHCIANMIEGPYFSREEAQNEIDARRHAYTKNARVFCMSGYHTEQYSSKVKF